MHDYGGRERNNNTQNLTRVVSLWGILRIILCTRKRLGPVYIDCPRVFNLGASLPARNLKVVDDLLVLISKLHSLKAINCSTFPNEVCSRLDIRMKVMKALKPLLILFSALRMQLSCRSCNVCLLNCNRTSAITSYLEIVHSGRAIVAVDGVRVDTPLNARLRLAICIRSPLTHF